MPDAWETLKDNSTLGFGDGWEHLNNQQGDGFRSVVLLNGLELEMADSTYDIEVKEASCEIEIDDSPLEVEVETPEYYVEVDD